jgi:transposase InsO family protein
LIECAGTLIGSAERLIEYVGTLIECAGTLIGSRRNQRSNAVGTLIGSGRNTQHHTDRGSPYASLAYTTILRQYGVVASMSRAGDCYDNAVVESFFGTLKAELVRQCVYPSRVVATALIGDYIENFYNPQSRHSHLQYLSPIEFELKAQTAALTA